MKYRRRVAFRECLTAVFRLFLLEERMLFSGRLRDRLVAIASQLRILARVRPVIRLPARRHRSHLRLDHFIPNEETAFAVEMTSVGSYRADGTAQAPDVRRSGDLPSDGGRYSCVCIPSGTSDFPIRLRPFREVRVLRHHRSGTDPREGRRHTCSLGSCRQRPGICDICQFTGASH